MTETVVNLVGSQGRKDKAHKDEGGMFKVVFVRPQSLRNGQIRGGVEREREDRRINGRLEGG